MTLIIILSEENSENLKESPQPIILRPAYYPLCWVPIILTKMCVSVGNFANARRQIYRHIFRYWYLKSFSVFKRLLRHHNKIHALILLWIYESYWSVPFQLLLHKHAHCIRCDSHLWTIERNCYHRTFKKLYQCI